MEIVMMDLHGGNTPGDPADVKTLKILKGCFIVVVFFLTIIAGILPVYVKACKESPTFLGLANAFSGGLFLAIGLFHILPEVSDQYIEYYEGLNEGQEPKFPLPFMLAFAGYTVVLMVDKVMFDSHSLFEGEHGHGHGHGHGE